MPTIVGITLRNAPSALPFDPADVVLSVDDVVIVTTERGTELGKVTQPVHERRACELPDVANTLVRKATPEDLEKAAELHANERAAMPVYRRLVNKHKFNMKPTEVELLFDGERAIFYFVAEDRIDFRELVRDLAAEFHIRIDMRQIGVRDEARMVGGLGHCGEQLCCVRFGGEFQPVSIRMAKEQDLPLNPLKISGLCGRLMCCLRYEYDAYKDFKSRAPKKGAIVDIGGTLAKVVDLDTPRERVTMRKEDGSRVTFALDEMECKCNGTCPCSVKADAIERSNASAAYDLSSVIQPRERKLTEFSGRRAPVVAPSSTDAPAPAPQAKGETEKTGTSRRRRRRGGGGSKGEGQAPAAEKSAKPRSEGRHAKAAKKAASAAPKQSAAPAADAAPKRRRRRRRGGGGGAPGEGAAPAGE